MQSECQTSVSFSCQVCLLTVLSDRCHDEAPAKYSHAQILGMGLGIITRVRDGGRTGRVNRWADQWNSYCLPVDLRTGT